MSYSITSNGEVYEDALLAGVPGWRYATLWYQARTKKRFGSFDAVRITDKASYDKLSATTVGTADDLDEAIRKADEAYAKSGAPTATVLKTKGEEFVAAQFVPSTEPVTPQVPETAAKGGGKKRKKKPGLQRRGQLPEWVLPAAIGGSALLIVLVLVATRRKAR